MLTVHELADLVKRTRLAQRNYFRTRCGTALAAAKHFERELDAALKEILEPPPAGLFDEKPPEPPKIEDFYSPKSP